MVFSLNHLAWLKCLFAHSDEPKDPFEVSNICSIVHDFQYSKSLWLFMAGVCLLVIVLSKKAKTKSTQKVALVNVPNYTHTLRFIFIQCLVVTGVSIPGTHTHILVLTAIIISGLMDHYNLMKFSWHTADNQSAMHLLHVYGQGGFVICLFALVNDIHVEVSGFTLPIIMTYFIATTAGNVVCNVLGMKKFREFCCLAPILDLIRTGSGYANQPIFSILGMTLPLVGYKLQNKPIVLALVLPYISFCTVLLQLGCIQFMLNVLITLFLGYHVLYYMWPWGVQNGFCYVVLALIGCVTVFMITALILVYQRPTYFLDCESIPAPSRQFI